MIGSNENFLYIGKAKNLSARVKSYTHAATLPVRLKRMVSLVQTLHIIQTPTESEALLLEASLIQKHKPPYNIVLKDNKAMPYLHVTHEAWPRLFKHRNTGSEPEGTLFGPFPSGMDVRLTQNVLSRSFGLRTCTDAVFRTRTRPCLQYHIKRCTGPCVGLISEKDYKKRVQNVLSVLKGKSSAVQTCLMEEMQGFSAKQDYEQAAQVRDRMNALARLQQKHALLLKTNKAIDVWALAQTPGMCLLYVLFFRQKQLMGGKALPAFSAEALKKNCESWANSCAESDLLSSVQSILAQFYGKHPPPSVLLTHIPNLSLSPLHHALKSHNSDFQMTAASTPEEKRLISDARTNAEQSLQKHLAYIKTSQSLHQHLQSWLGLAQRLGRIEVYDNTHLMGTHAYGAKIVADLKGFVKDAYRLYRMPTSMNKQDDYAMLRHVFKKRFLHKKIDAELLPDLVIVDGGKGHLAAAHNALKGFVWRDKMTLISIAKGPRRGKEKESFFTIDTLGSVSQKDLPTGPLYFYLERLRDEAHRFAIENHRRTRSKALSASSLDHFPGIGPKRKKQLLGFFGSADAVQRAPLSQIKLVPGLGPHMAEKLFEALQAKKNNKDLP